MIWWSGWISVYSSCAIKKWNRKMILERRIWRNYISPLRKIWCWNIFNFSISFFIAQEKYIDMQLLHFHNFNCKMNLIFRNYKFEWRAHINYFEFVISIFPVRIEFFLLRMNFVQLTLMYNFRIWISNLWNLFSVEKPLFIIILNWVILSYNRFLMNHIQISFHTRIRHFVNCSLLNSGSNRKNHDFFDDFVRPIQQNMN